MQFLNEKHKIRFKELLLADGTHHKDTERKTLFYIISGSDDLYSKRNHIYDFNNNWINIECLDSGTVDFSTSSKALIRLGFNLYNGYLDEHTSPRELLYSLDSKNYYLALNSCDIRFDVIVENEIVNEDEDELEM
ncbi:MAG: DUF6075 family protein [Marinisporobacter sp.]|jgi:hypothetical protein|nr:DUF6075 family protein [Marinisporobacter sp.]